MRSDHYLDKPEWSLSLLQGLEENPFIYQRLNHFQFHKISYMHCFVAITSRIIWIEEYFLIAATQTSLNSWILARRRSSCHISYCNLLQRPYHGLIRYGDPTSIFILVLIIKPEKRFFRIRHLNNRSIRAKL